MKHLLWLSRGDSGDVKVPVAGALVSNVPQIICRAVRALMAAQGRQKSHADRNRWEREFKVGEQVLLSTNNLKMKNPSSPKFLSGSVGPVNVTNYIGKVAYRFL